MIGKFVTAKLEGRNESRQGVVVSMDPFIIRGQSGIEYRCEGEPVRVDNPPPKCIGCDMELGPICGRCSENLKALVRAVGPLY